MYTEIDGVIINKLTLARFKELKAAGQISANEVYSITDIDAIDDGAYWKLRAGKVIACGANYCFFNQSTLNTSNLPLNTVLMEEVGANGNIFEIKQIYDNGVYRVVFSNIENTYSEQLAHGNSLNNMHSDSPYVGYNSVGYGDFVKITYIHPEYLKIIDSMCRINNYNF